MHANRVSANAEYGVSVVGGTSRLKANVIYANEKGGLCLRDTREASLLANCVARGGGEPLSVQGARKKRILKDLADSSTGNLFEGPGTRPADFREVVMHSLWVLEDWGRLRAGRIVIETLGEISHVAVSSNVTRHHLPSAAAPKQRAPQAVRRVRFCARTGHNSKV